MEDIWMKKIRTKQEYVEWTQKIAPKTHKLKNMIMAFITGGIICTIGQVILSLLVKAGMVKEDAASLTTLLMIFLGAFLTGINVYDDIGRIGGAGAAIPVTGFANSIVSPAMEYKKEGYIMGVGAKMFLIAGPVLVYGIVASIAAGILYYIFTINV
jgi:stage V sporulation protein AC